MILWFYEKNPQQEQAAEQIKWYALKYVLRAILSRNLDRNQKEIFG